MALLLVALLGVDIMPTQMKERSLIFNSHHHLIIVRRQLYNIFRNSNPRLTAELSLNDNEANTSQVVDAINDHAPETDGFVDDNEEWNEQEYGKTALEGDDEAAGETQLENATDDEHKNEVDEPDVSASLQGAEEMPKGYTPVRKRSFNEVEEEPEGQSTQCGSLPHHNAILVTNLCSAPNSKKPRHS